jgi:hypothetical protein
MEFDVGRCAQAAVRAALAEAFRRPDPTRTTRGRKRRLRPLRAMLRLVRLLLMSVGLATTVRIALDAELRRDLIESLAARFPIEDLLEEIAVEVDAARTALANAAGAEGDAVEGEPEKGPKATRAKAGSQSRRRAASRTRGDTNGRGGRKPPSRGTRAA